MAAKKTATKKKKAKSGSAKKAPAKKAASKKAPAKKATAKKTAKKATAKKAPAKKAASKKAPAKKTAAKKAPAKKATAKKAAAKAPDKSAAKTPTKKTPTRKAGSRRRRRPKYLTPAVMRRLREKLLARRQELLGAVASSAGDSRQQQSDGTEDYIDYAVSSYSKEFLLSLNELERKELGEVQDALARMERGEFGYCQASGEEIPLKRLEVQPWARYSIRYQEMVDQGMLSQDVLERPSFQSSMEDPLDAEVGDDDYDGDDDSSSDDDGETESASGKAS